jgi:hypothetical protein
MAADQGNESAKKNLAVLDAKKKAEAEKEAEAENEAARKAEAEKEAAAEQKALDDRAAAESAATLGNRGPISDVMNQVAVDAVGQYMIAKRQGDPTEICVQAKLVASAYLQAQNEAQYDLWKSTEKADCDRAGLTW